MMLSKMAIGWFFATHDVAEFDAYDDEMILLKLVPTQNPESGSKRGLPDGQVR